MNKTNIVRRATKALGISLSTKTDPSVIRDILREMKLEDFQTKFAPMKMFLRDATAQEQDLGPTIRCIQSALVKKHPAIVEFLDVALRKKWLKPSPKIHRALHVGYCLEAFTFAMANDRKFFLEVHRHITKNNKKFSVDCHHYLSTFINAWKVCRSVFETVKALSVDPAMIYFRKGKGLGDHKYTARELGAMNRKGDINYFEMKLLMPSPKGAVDHFDDLVRMNIYEAGVTDHIQHLKNNAACAEALNEDMVTKRFPEAMEKKKVLPDHTPTLLHRVIAHGKSASVYPTIDFSQEWVSLYTTWNAAFVLGCVDGIESILPKLFIPSIIDCSAQNFIGLRVISLWLCLCHNFFLEHDHGLPPKRTKLAITMAKAWGKINLRYAEALMNKDREESKERLRNNSIRCYQHPFLNWLKTAAFLLR